MKIKKQQLLQAACVATLVMFNTACDKDEDSSGSSNSDLLVGEWEFKTFYDDDSSLIFEADKDFKYCYLYEDEPFKYCYDGDWEWTNSDENHVKMNYSDGSDSYRLDLIIETMSAERIEGEFIEDGDTLDVVLNKK